MYTSRERRNPRKFNHVVDRRDVVGECARVESSIFDPKRHARRHCRSANPCLFAHVRASALVQRVSRRNMSSTENSNNNNK